MKRGFVVLFLSLILVLSFVAAMKGPITVYTEPGNRAKIYAWIPNGESQSLYELREGIADDEGVFSTTFFSLVDETVRYQVRIIDGLIPLRDDVFENFGTQNALKIDCIFEECVMSVDDTWVAPVEEVAVVTEDSGAVEENTEASDDSKALEAAVTSDEEKAEEVEKASEEPSEDGSLFAGLAIFTKSDGSTNWFGMSIFGVVLVLVIGAVFMFIHRGRNGSIQMMGGDEGELRSTERRVREVEDEIKSIKEKKEIKARIVSAKEKLAKEERELRKLMGNEDVSNSEIEDQKQAVSDARDELEEHRSNL